MTEKDNSNKISNEALKVRSEILVQCKEHCFDLTPEQVQTVINLYNETYSQKEFYAIFQPIVNHPISPESAKECLDVFGSLVGEGVPAAELIESMNAAYQKRRDCQDQRWGIKSDFSNNKLLVIELVNEHSAPRLFYEGEEVLAKARVKFEWETKTDKPGSLSYFIEHYETNEGGCQVMKSFALER